MTRSGLALLALSVSVAANAGPNPASGGETKKIPASARRDVCVQVEIGGDQASYLDCLNAQMAGIVSQQAGARASLQAVVSGSAPSSPTAMGLYNQTATRERLAGSFGHSVIPYRPDLVYGNPLLPPLAAK